MTVVQDSTPWEPSSLRACPRKPTFGTKTTLWSDNVWWWRWCWQSCLFCCFGNYYEKKTALHCTPLGVTFDCFVKGKMSRYYGQFVWQIADIWLTFRDVNLYYSEIGKSIIFAKESSRWEEYRWSELEPTCVASCYRYTHDAFLIFVRW